MELSLRARNGAKHDGHKGLDYPVLTATPKKSLQNTGTKIPLLPVSGGSTFSSHLPDSIRRPDGLPALVAHAFAKLSVFVLADLLASFLDNAAHKRLCIHCRNAGREDPPFYWICENSILLNHSTARMRNQKDTPLPRAAQAKAEVGWAVSLSGWSTSLRRWLQKLVHLLTSVATKTGPPPYVGGYKKMDRLTAYPTTSVAAKAQGSYVSAFSDSTCPARSAFRSNHVGLSDSLENSFSAWSK